jgi:hypothetical protein
MMMTRLVIFGTGDADDKGNCQLQVIQHLTVQKLHHVTTYTSRMLTQDLHHLTGL